MTVSHASKDSYVSQLVKLVDDAQKSKSKTQLLADTAAKWLTIIAFVAGISTFLYWYLTGETLAFAMERMVTVIVISCPHALGLAVPLVVAKSTAISAKNGLLIKNRIAFENSRKITTIVFDKTGTLTVGKFEVSKIVSLKSELNEDEIIRIASALEQQSEHPIATGILLKAKDLSVDIPSTENFKAITGKGIEATVEGKKVLVVSPGYLKEKKIAVPDDFKADDTETVVFVIINNELAGYIALSDEIRTESAEAIKTLKENHIKSILLTGDNSKVAKSVSDKLGLDSFIAEVLPDQKLEKIKELQGKGEFVAMTGDGINDAPALAQADVGIAVGSGSDIAAETAGIILVNSNPKDIVNLILFGKATHRKMIQNLLWATGYNIVALPLAAGVLYAWDILLTPAMGAVLMSASTVVVAINARLLRIKDEPKSGPEEEPQTNAETKPEVKDDTESKDESQLEAKVEPEVKSEPMPDANTEKGSEDKTELQPEAIVNNPSTLRPEIVKRVHEFYEELGREDVMAVMNMEKTEQKIPKPETKAENQPETESELKVKEEPKPKVDAIHQHKDNAKHSTDTKTKTKPEVKTGHQHAVKAKPKPKPTSKK